MQMIRLNVLYNLALLAVLGLTSSAWGQQTVSIFGDQLPPGGQYCFYPVQPAKFIQLYGLAREENGSGATGTTWSVWEGPTQSTVHTTRVFSQTSAGVGDIEALAGPIIYVDSGWAQVCVNADTSGSIYVNLFETWQ
jgi:hypothetical protein